MDIINSFIKNNRSDRQVSKYMELNDGFYMSVQASGSHYCSPRTDDAHPYSSFEIGFPSEQEELIMGYAEDPEEPTDTVYGHVPLSKVMEVVEKHGGIKGAKSFDDKGPARPGIEDRSG